MISNDKYTFRKQIFTCEQLLKMIEDDSLRFVGHTYGTNSRWNIGLKSMFIYQLLLGLQVPELIFDGSEKKWYVITGERQLDCINEYITGKLKLRIEAHGDSYPFESFEGLPLWLKRKMLNTEFSVSVLNPGITPNNRYNIYEMGNVVEGSSDLWAVAKFVFSEGYLLLEENVDKTIVSYPYIKKYRKQIIRLPLLWEIRNDLKKYTSKVSISRSTKIDTILIPLLEKYKPTDVTISNMIDNLSFLHYESCRTIFSWRSPSLKTVTFLLLLDNSKKIENEETFRSFLNKLEKFWKKRPVNLRCSSYTMLPEQINYMSNIFNK